MSMAHIEILCAELYIHRMSFIRYVMHTHLEGMQRIVQYMH
jgi:hypothetical protein